MLMPVRTAITCQDAFNLLDEAARYDEIVDDGDERLEWLSLCDRVAHATWVSEFLDSEIRERLAAFYADYKLQVAPRLATRPGESNLELITPAVSSNLLRRRDEDIKIVRRDSDYCGIDGLSRGVYVEVAKEGIFDWTVRAQVPTFELRRCLHCARWFTPMRSNRARFCSDSCRSRFSGPTPKGAVDTSNFVCAQCGVQRERKEFSGLIGRQPYDGTEIDPIVDLAISGYLESYNQKAWCIPCVLDYRPQFRRYVTTVEQERAGAAR